jgi:hypothetical protein
LAGSADPEQPPLHHRAEEAGHGVHLREQAEHRRPDELGHGTAGDATAIQGDCQGSPGLEEERALQGLDSSSYVLRRFF